RLTRSVPGEGQPAFLPDGSLLFTSARPVVPDGPGEDVSGADEKVQRLWLLPVGGGEPTMVADPPGGVEDFAVARDGATVVFAASALPGDDAGRRERRKAMGVTAILHEGLPVRSWDHQLGPGER